MTAGTNVARLVVLVSTVGLCGVPLRTAGREAGRQDANQLVIEPASLTTAETGHRQFEIGTLRVPENRQDPKSRIIGVGFARFRSLQPTNAPPVFLLPGGPGFSILSLLKPNSKRLALDLKQIDLYRRISDVVIVDQRGYSERGDVLQFEYRVPAASLEIPGTLAGSTLAYKDLARAAVTRMAGTGIDLRGYTITECADDVNDLRKALGYAQISLVGTSFGSQWSFAVIRRHASVVSRALLSGTEPLDYGYDMPSDVFAAIRRIWRDVEAEPQWQPYLPPGGMMAAARAVLARLERSPISVSVKDKRSGETRRVVIGLEDFQEAFLRTSEPAFLLSLYYEHYDDWARSLLESRRSRVVTIPLIGPLIDTSLGVTSRREYLLRTDPALGFLGRWNFDGALATSDIWPTADVGDELRTEVTSEVPVVFAHGDWDTSTPLENTLNVAPYFPRGRVMIVERGRHGVLDRIAEQQPAVMDALLEFLRTGDASRVPSRITLRPDRFDEIDFPAPSGVKR